MEEDGRENEGGREEGADLRVLLLLLLLPLVIAASTAFSVLALRKHTPPSLPPSPSFGVSSTV